ncbi:putative beta-glucosidase [Teratosphaeria nubilosa]|uniref:beta-glucosidase n=1 Tax=Teratosphaeria nubilosa TaxID=161662 RepID=A0A6G1LF64_9PEZI|nr:putative beta-glucosidase [Teratosphaeria nubilosa]
MGATLRLLALGHLAPYLFTGQAAAQNITAIIANLEHYYAYGRSPPVYPSPQGTGLGDWATAYSYAKSLVANMTNGEKQNLTIGYTSTTNGCSGNSYPVPSVGYPGMCLNDAGNGLRGTDGTSGYPSALHVGASWNRDLTLARASYMGKEFKAKGVNMALGPVVGPIGRVGEGGRNWEGFSNDPYLAGTLTGLTVQGLQESVIACTKHFIAYDQETNRNPDGYNASVSSNLDDKTMHELYLWPFQDAVHAGTGSVMCSYNRINGSYACQNSKTMNGLLKTELGFQGLVVSDWGGQHTGVASANAGLDMAMPDSDYWLGNLTTAVANGSLAQSRLDDMAIRIIATWYKFNPEPNPGFGVPANLSLPHEFVNGRSLDSASTILQGAVEGHVLVKNTGALPLSAPPFLSIYGYDAYAALQNQEDSYAPDGFAKWNLGYESIANLTDDETVDFFAETVYPNGPASAQAGTLISGGGSGAVTAPYVIAPFDALRTQAVADGTFLQWDFENRNPAVDQATSACLVFINEFASEGYDRPALADTYSDQLVLNVAARCNNTIVSINNAGIRTVDAWIDNENITAVIFAHLPGQDSGTALVELLYGKQSFSGRLPYTVAKKPSDYGDLLEPTVPTNVSDYYTQSNFTEGVYIDYKSFIARNITPRYAFGYGLTYSNFSYSGLQVNKYSNASFSLLPANSSIQEGGLPSLWDYVASVSATVTNTGKVEAAEVAQLYLGIPTGPAKQLRGYSKELLAPNASATVTFLLSRRDLSVWDTTRQQWILQTGTYNVYVGKSVLDIQLQSTLTI